MTLDYRQRPLLLLLLALLSFLSFSFAQSSNDTLAESNFILLVQPTLFVCEFAELSWSGPDTVPLYEVYLARGQGAIGDDASLDPEQWIAAVQETSLEWLVKPVWASPGDVLRFRVQDSYGKGNHSTMAWSTVEGSQCIEGTAALTTHRALSSFIVSIHTATDVTTKNTNINTANGDIMTTIRAPLSGTLDVTTPFQGPSQISSARSPTNTGAQNSNRLPGSGTGTKSPGQSSGQDPSLTVQGNPGDVSTVAAGDTTNRPEPTTLSILGGQQVSQISQTAVPNDASGQSDATSKQRGGLSAQAIGAIVGTIGIATSLWLFFVLWRRRRRRRAIALSPGQSPYIESTRGLLSPSSEAPAKPAIRPGMAEAPIYPQHGRQKLVPLPPSVASAVMGLTPAAGYGGARVPSYDEATGLYSPLVTPDPFRNSFNLPPTPGNMPTQSI